MAIILPFRRRPIRAPRPRIRRNARRSRRRARSGRDLLGFLLAGLLVAGAWAVFELDQEGRDAGAVRCTSLRVVDGDTLDCAGRRIRLIGIDTPEMPGHCRPGRDCMPGNPFTAKAYLQSLAVSGVSCRIAGEDAYGRALARCRSDAGDLSCAMIASGHAVRRYGALACGPLLASN